MPGKAPVDAVGGSKDSGPWPSDVEEIAEGETHQRPVRLSDGTVQEVDVTVTRVRQLTDRKGVTAEEEAYAVSFTYDDPTLDGGNA